MKPATIPLGKVRRAFCLCGYSSLATHSPLRLLSSTIFMVTWGCMKGRRRIIWMLLSSRSLRSSSESIGLADMRQMCPVNPASLRSRRTISTPSSSFAPISSRMMSGRNLRIRFSPSLPVAVSATLQRFWERIFSSISCSWRPAIMRTFFITFSFRETCDSVTYSFPFVQYLKIS